MDQYVVWAFILGGLSAISLLIGSLVGVSFKIPKSVTGLMAAFGAGALLSALAIELVAPTVSSYMRADESAKDTELHHFLAMVVGCFCGGLFLIPNQHQQIILPLSDTSDNDTKSNELNKVYSENRHLSI